MHQHQAVGQRHAHVVFEVDGRSTGAAFGAVHHDEVRRGADSADGLADGQHFPAAADAHLESRRLATGKLAHLRNELDELDRSAEHAVRRRADAVHAHGHAADLGDFLGDLVRRQHAADAGLGALAELQLHHLDLVVLRPVAELGRVEVAVLGAGAEVTGTHLPDQVAAIFLVVRGDTALAGVVGKPTHGRTLVQRAHGVLGQRAETHRGHVQHGDGVRLGAVLAAHERTGRLGRLLHRGDGVHEVLVVGVVDVLDGAERRLALLALRALVDGVALVAVEGTAVPVAFDEVLAQLRTDVREQVAHVPQNGVVAQDRVFGLCEVVNGDTTQRCCGRAQGALGKLS